MVIFKHTVKNELGFHARPVGLLVKNVRDLPCEITISKGELSANAKSIFATMQLCAVQGQELIVKCEGMQEQQIAKKLQKFFANNV